MTPRAWSVKENTDKLKLMKVKKTFTLWKIVRELKYKPWTGRKYLQSVYLIKDLYPEYVKNPQNKQPINNRQKSWTHNQRRSVNGK